MTKTIIRGLLLCLVLLLLCTAALAEGESNATFTSSVPSEVAWGEALTIQVENFGGTQRFMIWINDADDTPCMSLVVTKSEERFSIQLPTGETTPGEQYHVLIWTEDQNEYHEDHPVTVTGGYPEQTTVYFGSDHISLNDDVAVTVYAPGADEVRIIGFANEYIHSFSDQRNVENGRAILAPTVLFPGSFHAIVYANYNDGRGWVTLDEMYLTVDGEYLEPATCDIQPVQPFGDLDFTVYAPMNAQNTWVFIQDYYTYETYYEQSTTESMMDVHVDEADLRQYANGEKVKLFRVYIGADADTYSRSHNESMLLLVDGGESSLTVARTNSDDRGNRMVSFKVFGAEDLVSLALVKNGEIFTEHDIQWWAEEDYQCGLYCESGMNTVLAYGLDANGDVYYSEPFILSLEDTPTAQLPYLDLPETVLVNSSMTIGVIPKGPVDYYNFYLIMDPEDCLSVVDEIWYNGPECKTCEPFAIELSTKRLPQGAVASVEVDVSVGGVVSSSDWMVHTFFPTSLGTLPQPEIRLDNSGAPAAFEDMPVTVTVDEAATLVHLELYMGSGCLYAADAVPENGAAHFTVPGQYILPGMGLQLRASAQADGYMDSMPGSLESMTAGDAVDHYVSVAQEAYVEQDIDITVYKAECDFVDLEYLGEHQRIPLLEGFGSAAIRFPGSGEFDLVFRMVDPVTEELQDPFETKKLTVKSKGKVPDMKVSVPLYLPEGEDLVISFERLEGVRYLVSVDSDENELLNLEATDIKNDVVVSADQLQAGTWYRIQITAYGNGYELTYYTTMVKVVAADTEIKTPRLELVSSDNPPANSSIIFRLQAPGATGAALVHSGCIYEQIFAINNDFSDIYVETYAAYNVSSYAVVTYYGDDFDDYYYEDADYTGFSNIVIVNGVTEKRPVPVLSFPETVKKGEPLIVTVTPQTLSNEYMFTVWYEEPDCGSWEWFSDNGSLRYESMEPFTLMIPTDDMEVGRRYAPMVALTGEGTEYSETDVFAASFVVEEPDEEGAAYLWTEKSACPVRGLIDVHVGGVPEITRLHVEYEMPNGELGFSDSIWGEDPTIATVGMKQPGEYHCVGYISCDDGTTWEKVGELTLTALADPDVVPEIKVTPLVTQGKMVTVKVGTIDRADSVELVLYAIREDRNYLIGHELLQEAGSVSFDVGDYVGELHLLAIANREGLASVSADYTLMVTAPSEHVVTMQPVNTSAAINTDCLIVQIQAPGATQVRLFSDVGYTVTIFQEDIGSFDDFEYAWSPDVPMNMIYAGACYGGDECEWLDNSQFTAFSDPIEVDVYECTESCDRVTIDMPHTVERFEPLFVDVTPGKSCKSFLVSITEVESNDYFWAIYEQAFEVEDGEPITVDLPTSFLTEGHTYSVVVHCFGDDCKPSVTAQMDGLFTVTTPTKSLFFVSDQLPIDFENSAIVYEPGMVSAYIEAKKVGSNEEPMIMDSYTLYEVLMVFIDTGEYDLTAYAQLESGECVQVGEVTRVTVVDLYPADPVIISMTYKLDRGQNQMLSVMLEAADNVEVYRCAIEQIGQPDNSLMLETEEPICMTDSAWFSEGIYSMTIQQINIFGLESEYVTYFVVHDGGLLTLPAGLTGIDEEAFIGTAAQVITVPEGCQSIGANAFANCPNLMAVFIPKNVTSIDSSALGNNKSVWVFGDADSAAERFAEECGLQFAPIVFP